MENDGKSLIKNNGEPAKDGGKVVTASKRSGRKNKTTIEEKEKTKENELPPALLPKFPSHKSLRRRSSGEAIEVTPMYPSDQYINENDENEMTRELEREKAENHWEEGLLVIDELQLKEEEMEQQQKEMQENAHASPSDQNSLEANQKKMKQEKVEKCEKPVEKKVDKASARDKKSGRSEDRKKNKKDVASSDEKKSNEDKNKGVGLRKKASAEDANSDEFRKSGRKSKRLKKSVFKPPVQKPGQPPTQGPTSIYQLPMVAAPKNERSLKLNVGEPKSYDDRGKKLGAYPKKDGQKGPAIPAKSPLPGTPGTEIQKNPQLPPTPQQLQQQQQLQLMQKKRRVGFLKNVYQKTKFWGRKADCVADPSMDFLSKSYVKPDYDPNNPTDFLPELSASKILSDEEWAKRNSNIRCSKEEVFINMRPFWLTRTINDTTPKVRIQLHRPLKQMYQGNPSCILPKLSRTETFCDPKKDSIVAMKTIDPLIGVDLNYVPKDAKDQKDQKDKELNRVCANTFHATIMFETEKISWDTRKKKSEYEGKQDTQRRGKKEKAQKSSFEEGKEQNSKPNVTFEFPLEWELQIYNRKHRPQTKYPNGATVENRRRFAGMKYGLKPTKDRKDNKVKARSPSGGPVSANSTSSNSQSSSAEGKKN
ncbi:unnamed protein product [Caenorhabditis nigoni]